MNNFFRLSLLGLLIIFLIVIFHYVGWLKPLENGVVNFLNPAQERFYTLVRRAKNFQANWLTNRNLLKENEVLKNQLERLQVEKSRINSLESENNLLKEELNFVKEKKINTIAAKIITGVSDSLSKSVIINRGSDSGLTKGLAVIAGEGVVVGKVSEVYPNYSKVLLLIDNKSKVAATIQNSDKTTGLVEGQFGLSLAMTNIPQDQEVKVDDLIVTSGLEGKIPKDLLIAKVENVNQVESEIFKTALLRPIISFNNLSYVLVVVP